ncbi:MAG: AraC family transcriptional regulator, partial [Anaerotignum sp.]|nr:AraC family transcriptional regulator [Anaerotignum sp.]
QERRLLHARDLIRQGISATDSCFQSGFRSYSSFTRAYAKHFGTTPTGRKGAPADETYE